MSNSPKTVLIISGQETSDFAKGDYNRGLATAAKSVLEPHLTVLTTDVESGYDVAEEIEKFKAADVVIYQYPVYWFMMPPSLKKYMDDVYAYGEFFAFSDGPYGSGGLMKGKQLMLSTTWNAPEEAFNDPDSLFEGDSVSEALAPMRRSHFYCGFGELRHFSAHNIIADPQFDAHKTAFENHLRSAFGLAADSKAA